MAHVPSHANKVVEIAPVAEYDSKGTRLTCVTVGDGEVLAGVDGRVNGKRKREDDEEAEGGDVSEEEGGFGSGWEDEGKEVDEEEVEDEEDAEDEKEQESEG